MIEFLLSHFISVSSDDLSVACDPNVDCRVPDFKHTEVDFFSNTSFVFLCVFLVICLTFFVVRLIKQNGGVSKFWSSFKSKDHSVDFHVSSVRLSVESKFFRVEIDGKIFYMAESSKNIHLLNHDLNPLAKNESFQRFSNKES